MGSLLLFENFCYILLVQYLTFVPACEVAAETKQGQLKRCTADRCFIVLVSSGIADWRCVSHSCAVVTTCVLRATSAIGAYGLRQCRSLFKTLAVFDAVE